MFPWIYEFRWTASHIIFLGIFFSVAILIASTVTLAAMRVYKDFKKRRDEAILWEADFEDLPATARACRHELTGEVNHRTCDHGFDCRSCRTHPTLLAKRSTQRSATQIDNPIFGFNMPLDRLYHRGHTWVKHEGNGVYLVGLDDFGARMIGKPDALELPEPGSLLQANGTCWTLTKQDATLRILSPIDGEVLERGGTEMGWYLKIRGDESEAATRHLLCDEEIRPWVMREFERLQLSLSTDGLGTSLADGGELVAEMWKHAPDVDWDGVWGEMFLQA